MRNRVISYSFRGFNVFQKVPVVIIMRFGENNVLLEYYIDTYKFWGLNGGLHASPYIFCLLFMQSEKVKKHDLY